MEGPSNRPVKYGYLPLILGLIFIVLGIWVVRTPVQFFITLSLVFAFAFMATGIIEVTSAVSNRKALRSWGWSLAGGIIDLFIGVLLVSRPQLSMIILPLFIGFGICFRSIMAIGWSVELRKYGTPDWGWILAIGLTGVLLSFIILWNPLFAGLTIAVYAALSFIVLGISQVILSFRFRKINRKGSSY